jgi:methyl-accepting chemotaxis protein
MTRTKRGHISRGKSILSAAGPQSRFILFLVFLLIAYTLLLRVFQKLAAIVELPVFLPIALVTLLLFIGIAGTIYSHRFVGPMARIRQTLEHVAAGDCAVTLRLRENDDPMLKDLVQTITELCDNSRLRHTNIHETAQDLLKAIEALREAIRSGAQLPALQQLAEGIRSRQELFEKALRSLGR